MDRIFKARGYPEIWWYVGGEPDKFGIGFVKLAAELADSIRQLGAKANSVLMGPMGAKMFPGHFDHLWGNPATPLTEEFRTTCLSKGTGFGVHNGGDTRFQAGFQFWRTGSEGRYQETQFYTDFMRPYCLLPWNYNTAQAYPAPDGSYRPTARGVRSPTDTRTYGAWHYLAKNRRTDASSRRRNPPASRTSSPQGPSGSGAAP